MHRQNHVIPLLKDHHTHPYLYAATENGVNLSAGRFAPQSSKEELLEQVSLGIPGWVIAYEWNSGLFELHQQDFDGLKSPVVVLNLSLHGIL